MMMLSLIPIFCYLTAAGMLAYCVFKKREHLFKPLIYLLWIGLVFHTIILSYQILLGNPSVTRIDISSFKALSLTSLIMLLLIISEIKQRTDIALAIIPLAAITIAGSILFRSHNFVESDQSIALGIHIISSICAYAILSLAATQAIFLYLRDKFLKRGMPQILKRLPPLMKMEASLFRLLTLGFALLSVSLISGIYFFELWFTKPFIHKTILSLAAWIMFGSLLFAHHIFGLRGKPAIRWMLIAFMLLIIAITGTRFIQEFILNRYS